MGKVYCCMCSRAEATCTIVQYAGEDHTDKYDADGKLTSFIQKKYYVLSHYCGHCIRTVKRPLPHQEAFIHGVQLDYAQHELREISIFKG